MPPLERPSPPPSLVLPCTTPQRLPEQDLTAAQTEILWGRDRAALLTCKSRLDGLIDWTKTTGAPGNPKE